MAKGNKNKKPENVGQADTTKKRKTRMDRIRENKPLFGVVVLVGLIILAAIGVGAYYAIDSLTSKDDEVTEDISSVADDEQTDGEEAGTTEENQQNSEEEPAEETTEEPVENNEESEQTSEEENGTTEEENSEEENAPQDSNGDESEDTKSSNDSEEDANQEQSEENQNSESANEDADNTQSEDTNSIESGASTQATGHSAGGIAKSLAVQDEIAKTGVWRATDYMFGDIVESDYTVQLGDTLWEIADGFYGDGFQWTEILNANSNTVDVLPNGQEALIYPGTQLTLPE